MTTKALLELEPNLSASYLKRAFLLQYNVILLGGAGLFSLASASALPLLAGLGLEVVWLAVAPNVAAFRRFLDQVPAEAPPVSEEPAPSVAPPPPRPSLDPPYASRAASVEKALGEVRELGGRLDAPSLRHIGLGLEAIAHAFTGLCENHQKLSKYLSSTPEAALTQEIETMKRAFSAEKDLGLRLAIRQSMTLAQRRLEQRTSAEKSLKTLSVRIETLERAVGSLRGQAQALGVNQAVMAEVDALRHEVGTDVIEEETIPRSFPPSKA